MIRNKILVVAAHPDDEVLGCGGTIARLSPDNEIYTLILGEGITSRDISMSQKERELEKLKQDVKSANEILGVKKVFLENFQDNRFDSVNLLDIVKKIEGYILKIKPDIIYTHHHGDLNIDHRITFNAALTASRPIEDSAIKKIYSFEVLSSTEWNTQSASTVFVPNIYINISDTISKKIEAMEAYRGEIMGYPHPRSTEGIRILAQKRGLEVGLEFAEAFCLIREVQ